MRQLTGPLMEEIADNMEAAGFRRSLRVYRIAQGTDRDLERELIAMARAVDFMVLQASDPVIRVLFATDAMGADDVMLIVGDLGFAWTELQASRWHSADHITIGASGGVASVKGPGEGSGMHHFRPHRLDPLHVNSVLSDTYERYERAVEKFEVFLLLNDAAPTSAAELDDWLVLFRREASLTRSQFEVTLVGIRFLAPRLKGKLPLAKKVTKGLAIEYPAKHAFPMLSRRGLEPILRALRSCGNLRNDHWTEDEDKGYSCEMGLFHKLAEGRAGFATEAIIKGEAPTLAQRWKRNFAAGLWIPKLPRPLATCWATSRRGALQWQPMGRPVTVAIADASEEESSEYQPPVPSRSVRSQPRQRAMTPLPRASQARPNGRRSKLDGSSVLTREVRAQLPAGGLVGSVADGTVRDPPRRGALRRKQACWFSWAWRSCCKGAARLRVLLLWGSLAYVMAAGPMRELLMPVQSLLVSTAQVGESAAGALSSILDGGTQLVSASTSVVKAASVNTLSVAQAAWIGVDLVGMNATKVVGRVMGETSEAIELWLFSEQGREVLRDPAQEALTFWLGMLRSQTFHLPVVAADTEALVASGDHWTASGIVSFAANGLVVFEFRLLRMHFAPRWANPVWQVGGWNAEDEYDQILLLARGFAATVPAVNHTWDHVLAPPPSSADWPAFVGLLRRFGALCGSPFRSCWRFWASMWEYGTMHPLAFGGLVLVIAGGCLCVRRLGPLAAPPAALVHWRRLVELMLLMRGWMLVRGGSLTRQLLH
ncbi:unnamed protein product [Symbiodinium sp. CCMP2456]|nr:unnamed protein product [Symbiodinium sp. CCMP2456]